MSLASITIHYWWIAEGPRIERRMGIDTRAWNKPTETSSIITWNKVTTKRVVLKSTLKNKWMKVMEASAKTTVARKVEKAPWKTWGPVLVEIKKFQKREIFGQEKEDTNTLPGMR